MHFPQITLVNSKTPSHASFLSFFSASCPTTSWFVLYGKTQISLQVHHSFFSWCSSEEKQVDIQLITITFDKVYKNHIFKIFCKYTKPTGFITFLWPCFLKVPLYVIYFNFFVCEFYLHIILTLEMGGHGVYYSDWRLKGYEFKVISRWLLKERSKPSRYIVI